MIVLDRLALADYFEPKDLVNEIYRQCPDLKLPIPIKDIAKACGILAIEPLNLHSTTKLEGILFSDRLKEYGVIFFKPHPQVIGRERFSIGHELGHHLSQHHEAINVCIDTKVQKMDSGTKKVQEDEANDFSKFILMPEFLLRPLLSLEPFTLEVAVRISAQAEVSFSALANRCCELLNECKMILVYSKDHQCVYSWANWSILGDIKLKKLRGQALPDGSQTLKTSYRDNTISVFETVQPKVWFDDSSDAMIPEHVIEQTYFQENGYAVTLLIIDPNQEHINLLKED